MSSCVFFFRCGSIGYDKDSCRLVEDLSKPYPQCCPDIVCDHDEIIDDFETPQFVIDGPVP